MICLLSVLSALLVSSGREIKKEHAPRTTAKSNRVFFPTDALCFAGRAVGLPGFTMGAKMSVSFARTSCVHLSACLPITQKAKQGEKKLELFSFAA